MILGLNHDLVCIISFITLHNLPEMYEKGGGGFSDGIDLNSRVWGGGGGGGSSSGGLFCNCY